MSCGRGSTGEVEGGKSVAAMTPWHDSLAPPPRVLISHRPSDASGQGIVLSLQHPRSGDEVGYLFIDGQLQEINWFKERYGAWFLGDYVCEDGGLYYCTPVDPIFIFLPTFEAARMSNDKDPGKFRQLDEILYVEGYPGYQQLMNVANHHMELVCEVKVSNMKFFRLDNSKVLSWLCCKVYDLKEVFPKLGKNYAAQTEKEKLKEAVQMIREYLKDEPWLALLCKKLQLDINAITVDATTKTAEASVYADSCPAPALPSESKTANGGAKSSKGRPAKKAKTEVGSKNIKDMFRRVTRSGSGS
uniref:Ribonuclease H2 subunit B n=1 Tax=Zea mays TaxID=4577 RepID=A0A804MEN3_MAIZE